MLKSGRGLSMRFGEEMGRSMVRLVVELLQIK